MNWTAILVAAVAGYVIGALWYGPLFGKLWMKLSGITKKKIEKDKDRMPLLYFGGFVTAFVIAAVFAVLLDFLGWKGWENGVILGFWLWLGFIATVSFGGVLWMGQKFKLWVLNNAYSLLELLVMGAILASW